MNLLFVCDQYPPFEQGGYAQLCFDLAGELRRMGHAVAVLCEEPHGQPKGVESEPVYRRLRIPNEYNESIPIPVQQYFFAPARRAHNEAVFKTALEETGADTVIFWPNLYGDPHLWLSALKYSNLLVSFYVAGISPGFTTVGEYWSYPGKSDWIRKVKSFARPLMTRSIDRQISKHIKHVMCVSEFERNRMIIEGINPEEIIVIHNGIELEQFPFRGLPSAKRNPSKLRFIYSGRLVPEKGAHTIIESLAKLIHDYPLNTQIDLTILGSGSIVYEGELKQLADKMGVSEMVKFHGWIPRIEVSTFLSNYDIIVLPTIRPEALSRAIQEAMAIGLVVIATPTGGTPELIENNKTGLLFSPEDSRGLAKCLYQLSDDPVLCDKLVTSARDIVERKFTLQRMAESVITSLSWWRMGRYPKIHHYGHKAKDSFDDTK